MKTQTTKKLFAFITILMFSVGIVNAQCPANKVLMHRGKGCITKCVPSSQVDKYLSQGWLFGGCPIPIGQNSGKLSNKKLLNKALVKIPEYAIVSKKAGRR